MALLKKKEFETFYLRNVSVSGSPIVEITESQLLVGNSEKADLIVNSNYVNHYHAVITYVNGALFVSDLCTVNGTKVNGTKVRHAQLTPGDLIEFGNIKFEFGETTTEEKINDANQKLEIIKNDEKEPDLPPIPTPAQVQAAREATVPGVPNPLNASTSNQDKTLANLYYVDGEYCDIKFNEDKFKAPKNLVLDNGLIHTDEFIEEEQRDHLNLYEGKEEFSGRKTLEVIFVSHGNIISYDIIREDDWGKADFLLSDEITSYIGFDNPKSGFIELHGSEIRVNLPMGFSLRGKSVSEAISLDEEKELVFEKGVHQIFVRYSKELRETNQIPMLWRDKAELKRIGQRFLIFFLPFLLLTFVTIEQEEKKKNVVVIYKRKIEKKVKKQSLASDSKKKDSPKKEEAKKISENKSDISNKQKVEKQQKVAKAPTKTQVRKRNKKAAKSSTKASKKVATSRKPKPQLKLAANFSKMLGSSQFKSKSFSKSSSTSSASSSASAQGLAVAQGSSLSTVGGGNSVKGLGTSSKYGNGKGYKSNGLGKNGFDSSFTSTKTVVVGAIDPDILRRLLREHIPQFRYCYQEELGRNSKIKGIIDLNFTINGRGKVAQSNVASKNGKFSKKGIGCITSVLKSIPFPKPKGGGVVEVKQPLNFSSEKTKV